jgi:acyl-CoA reductase-like NAD-dependent aldehyde dehydrogenase
MVMPMMRGLAILSYGINLGHPERGRAEGATIACGAVPDGGLGGLFVQPTVLTGIAPESTVYREEVFGPVLAALAFTSEDEAVNLANDTPYGLAGAVWTKDVHRAHRVAARIKVGSVWINAYPGGRALSALRWVPAVRARPGERHPRHRRLPRGKGDLGRVHRRHPRPFRTRLIGASARQSP